MNKQATKLSRRTLLRRSALTGAAFQIVPGYVLGLNGQTPPSGKLNVAGIGVGGMGGSNIGQCAKNDNIVALCDIDKNYAAKTFQAYPSAKTYTDYRTMLDQQKDIDAIVIATPDHTHAPIAMACMRAGKHVYVQKPMAYSVGEARAMTEAARQHKVITQMGNQGRSGDGVRMVCEWIWAGAIGTVREVHAWTNRPVWPQGIEVGPLKLRLCQMALIGINGSAQRRCVPTTQPTTRTVGAHGVISARAHSAILAAMSWTVSIGR